MAQPRTERSRRPIRGITSASGKSPMLKGKTAIVTGSTSGIGLGIATALAAEGSRIMLNGFGHQAAIEKICRGLTERHGIEVAYSPADMSKPEEIRQLVADAERKLGPVDILVNNAGIQHVAPIEEFPDEACRSIRRKRTSFVRSSRC